MIDKSSRGSLSFDFLIGITVSCLLLIFVILTSLTFSLVEVAQYIAYATARTYFIGHKNYDEHVGMAEGRYDDLNQKFFKAGSDTAMSKWFFLSGMSIYDSGRNAGFSEENRTRFGVGFTFTSKVLTMEIPFLGKVGSGTSGFAFPIAAFLGREVSTAECSSTVGAFVQGGNGC